MDDIIEEFLVESYENIDRLDIELVELEENPDSSELLPSIFRNLHTIKGTAGFFGFSNLESVSHAAENLLSLLRSGDLQISTDIVDALLATVDTIRKMLDTVSETKGDGDNPYSELTAKLHALADPSATPPAPAAEPVDAEPEDAPAEPEAVASEPEAVGTGSEAVVAEPEAVATEPEAAAAAAAPPAEVVEEKPVEHHSSVADASIRVDVGLLDRLMNLVGELVLARNQVLQYQGVAADPAFQSTSQQLDLITTDLQEGVMKTRMQPIGNVWSKLPRVVRDLAAQCDKKVRLEMEGEDTELDKTILEAIKDPLTHIVRNSVDHGLETPADRSAAGKDEVGLLKLRAYHEGGQVIIEIVDDGGGLDHDRIKSKAISSGIVSAERVATMTDRDVANLIFRPGFSTAAKVTNVSGRGVGMDVVKTNVEKIGGTLEIQSQRGAGTTLTIKIPLTLAIIPALIITCDSDRYLLPQINLVEVLHTDGGTGDTKIEMAGDAEVLRLRGNLLPIVHLRDVLGLPSAKRQEPIDTHATEAGEGQRGSAETGGEDTASAEAGVDQHGSAGNSGEDNDTGVNIAVLQADSTPFGLVVDRINDTEEIVVKPLSPHLKGIGAFAGTTIMGDGAVSLILDATGLARMGGVVHDEERSSDLNDGDKNDDRRDSTQLVLVCTIGETRVGIPLALVSRLEEFRRDQVERASGSFVIQYRGRLLSLIDLRKFFSPGSSAITDGEDDSVLQVLVYETEDNIHGLVVDEIIDVFETDFADAQPSDHLGLAMSGVIGRRVTDLLDIDEIVAAASPKPAMSRK